MYKTIVFIFICIFISIYYSFVIIQEGQRGIVLRFNKILRDEDNHPLIYKPGLHVKIPFIDQIKILDARIQTMENQADRFVTMEKKDLIVDSYIKWKISNFNRYYLATDGGDITQAELLLRRKFSDRLRSEFGRLGVRDIVTDSRNQLMRNVLKMLNKGTSGSNKISKINKKGKIVYASHINETWHKNNDQLHFITNLNSMKELGIEVVDVKIKQINLPNEVYDAIYQRMRAEREAVSRHLRSQGQEKAEKLRATADYEVVRTLAQAKHKALIIRGEADAQTSKLYADAFKKQPSFYIFIRTLYAYKNSFNGTNDFFILNHKNNFFKFMKYPEDK